MNVSIYIKESNLGPLEGWLNSIFHLIELVDEDDDLYIYHGRYKHEKVSITVTINVPEEHGYSCLYFVFSGQTKWQTDRDCAKEAFSILGKKVVCSTNEIDNNPLVWLHITENGEEVSDQSW